MRKSKRKLLAALLAAAVLLSAGCAPEQAAPVPPKEPPDPPAEETEPAPEPTPAPIPEEEPETKPDPEPAPDLDPNPEPAPEPEPAPAAEPADEEMVEVKDYIPGIFVDLKYATEDNFTGKVIYDFTNARLRYGTVRKLAAVQAALLEQGYSLKIWDAHRPAAAQFTLWEVCPDPVYVANPNKGYSSHSRGNTVDVTLVLSDGTDIEMPTGFDDFSTLADRDYSDVPEPARSNALLLENTMADHGFTCYSGEWWHFADEDSYPVAE